MEVFRLLQNSTDPTLPEPVSSGQQPIVVSSTVEYLLMGLYTTAACTVLMCAILFLLRKVCASTRRGRIPNSSSEEFPPLDFRNGLPDDAIEKIRSLPFSELKKSNISYMEDSESEVPLCAICLSEFENDDMIRCLDECYHQFHQVCLDLWLKRKGICPLCKLTVVLPTNSPKMHSFNRLPSATYDHLSRRFTSIRCLCQFGLIGDDFSCVRFWPIRFCRRQPVSNTGDLQQNDHV